MNISVVLPVYNEAKCIDKTLETILSFASSRSCYSFIFVSDGSDDGTNQMLQSTVQTTNQITMIAYETRKGKGHAVRTGVEYADGDYICFIDSDLAYSLEHLDLIVEKLEEFDVVIGCRNMIPESVKNVNLSRRIAGEIFNLLSRKMLDLYFSDMQAGIKGFRKSVAKDLFKKQEMTGFSFDVELIYLAKKRGYTIGQIPAIVSAKHLAKASKVDLLTDSLKMFTDLLRIKNNDAKGLYE